MGLADVEANYAVVKAYQYTTLTSIQVGGNCHSLCLDWFIKPLLWTVDITHHPCPTEHNSV